MKTKTILPIFLVIIALTLTSFALIPKQVNSIQGSYMYVSLSYLSRGWIPWTCVVDQGSKADDSDWNHLPTCSEWRDCPFKGNFFSGACRGILSEISIPEDIKLVTSDNHVIGDEICADETFKFTKGQNKGEWWGRGGHADTPPIYWVDDVEKLTLDIISYHENGIISMVDFSNPSGVPDGFVDELTGIPVFTTNLPPNEITGSIVCSIRENEFEIQGAKESAGYYKTTGEDINFNTEFTVECMYYYFGLKTTVDIVGIGNISSDYYTFRVPAVIQAGPEATVYDYNTHNIKYNSIEDFFRVGTISFNKNIKVVEPVEEPELHIKTIITDTALDHGETTYAHLLITNNGATAITLKDIESNVNHEFIYCDKETLEPGEQADCALTLTPDTETDITATVNFEYRRCGKRIESSKRQASSTIMVQPLERCTKSQDCEEGKVCCNRICRTEAKGACDDFNGDGTFEWSYY